MHPRHWADDLDLPANRAGAHAAEGYAQHAARTERTLGLILWFGLAVVIVVTSL